MDLKQATLSAIHSLLQSGSTFSSGNVSNLVKRIMPDARHSDVADIVRQYSGNFLYGNRAPLQTRDYTLSTLYPSFAPSGVFVYHPSGTSAQGYRFPVLIAPSSSKPAAPQSSYNQRQQQICRIVAEQLSVDEDDVRLETTFKELGVDSLDAIEIVMAIEEEFNVMISDDEAEQMKTVGDIDKYLTNARLDTQPVAPAAPALLARIAVEGQGRIRIPKNVVDEIKARGKVTIEPDQGSINVFMITG